MVTQFNAILAPATELAIIHAFLASATFGTGRRIPRSFQYLMAIKAYLPAPVADFATTIAKPTKQAIVRVFILHTIRAKMIFCPYFPHRKLRDHKDHA